MRQKKALLLGSYGQSNLGDDLLMWNYLKLLEDHQFTEIYVNANTREFIPSIIKKAYPNLKVILTYETSLSKYTKLIKDVDCVVYGGGTLYKELYSSTGRSPYGVIFRLMAFNILARLLGTPVYHLNIGTGSLKTRLGRFITKVALKAATKSTFRDKESFAFARDELNVPTRKIVRSVDGLFLNPDWKSVWRDAPIAIDRKKYERVIGVNVLSDIPDWIDRSTYIATIKQFVKTLLKRGDFVVFVPFQTAFNPRNDLAFMRDTFHDIMRKYENQLLLEDVSIDHIQAYLRQCDVFVGMRFHSLLLCCVGTVPFVGLAYDMKCWRFIEEANYPYAMKLENLDHDALVALCDEALEYRRHAERLLGATSQKMYEEAEKDLRTLNL